MMRSATDFLPRVISTLTNLATSTLWNFGSGRISRFGTSLRRGMVAGFLSLCGLRRLGAVLRTTLLAVLHALGVERAAHDVVAHAGQVLDAPAADQHHRVFLQVVAFAADVADDLEAAGETHLRYLAQGGIGLLGRSGIDPRADSPLLRRAGKRRDFRLGALGGAPSPH